MRFIATARGSVDGLVADAIGLSLGQSCDLRRTLGRCRYILYVSKSVACLILYNFKKLEPIFIFLARLRNDLYCVEWDVKL